MKYESLVLELNVFNVFLVRCKYFIFVFLSINFTRIFTEVNFDYVTAKYRLFFNQTKLDATRKVLNLG